MFPYETSCGHPVFEDAPGITGVFQDLYALIFRFKKLDEDHLQSPSPVGEREMFFWGGGSNLPLWAKLHDNTVVKVPGHKVFQ